jgi:hypothetical protein
MTTQQQQNATAEISESARNAIDNANAAWRDSSQYITIPVGEELTLKFHPDMAGGIEVKQDTFQGQPSGYKTFYQVVDVNSSNTSMRTFKANRKSSLLINKELAKGNWVQRIKRVGDGMNTMYQPFPVSK